MNIDPAVGVVVGSIFRDAITGSIESVLYVARFWPSAAGRSPPDYGFEVSDTW